MEVLLLNFAFVEFVKVVRWICLGCYMDLSKLISESLPRLSQCVTQERGAVDMRRRQVYLEVLLINFHFFLIVELVKVVRWISLRCYMDFSVLLHGFIKIDA